MRNGKETELPFVPCVRVQRQSPKIYKTDQKAYKYLWKHHQFKKSIELLYTSNRTKKM